MNKKIILGSMLLGMILFSGCCGSTGSSYSSSSHCTTYGEACTSTCEAMKGTEYDPGENCFSDCMGTVKSSYNSDATTCCKETIDQNCQRTCDDMYNTILSQYGSDAMDETRSEFMEPCLGECTGAYVQMGIPTNSCSVADAGAVVRETMGDDR